MNKTNPLRVVLLKPSKYAKDGFVERFRKGFMPNSTLLHLKSMTPAKIKKRTVDVLTIDEYVQTDLRYLDHMQAQRCDLLALVGVQSHQMHRAMDLCAYARSRGVASCVIGGPHPMTCDTTEIQGLGVSLVLSEAELVWQQILHDACDGELRPVYGDTTRWQGQLDAHVLDPPPKTELSKYVIPMLGVYPARGCPYQCNFCSVIKIAGTIVRSHPVTTTVESLLAARSAGVRLVMFTSDNFNKYRDAKALLEAMIDARVGLPFFAQCDAQLYRDPDFVDLMARAGCSQVFVGTESFDRATLRAARKAQNYPERYARIVEMCHQRGISVHFSNIFGFPNQSEQDIAHHLHELRSLRPFMASFYVLTPIPGTEQYDEFLRDGLIVEKNLDRFDATCAVWRHPKLTAGQLEGAVSRAYREFYNASDVFRKMFERRWNAPGIAVHAFGFGYALQARLSVRRGLHPMAGGWRPVRVDQVDDYVSLRRSQFKVSHLSLPRSLSVSSPADTSLYSGEIARQH